MKAKPSAWLDRTIGEENILVVFKKFCCMKLLQMGNNGGSEK